MHYSQLTRVIELQAGNPLAAGQDRRFGQSPQLPTVDEGFHARRGQPVAQRVCASNTGFRLLTSGFNI
jgi:hypothetical protein